MTQSTAARQRAYKARKQAQGLVRVSEWVHKDDAAALRLRAETLRLMREQAQIAYPAAHQTIAADGQEC